MINKFSLLLALSTSLILGACANVAHKTASTVILEVNDIATGPFQTRPAVMEIDNEPALVFSTKEDRVAFQKGSKRQLIDESARVKKGGSFLRLNRHNNAISVLWWSHENGKNVYFTSSKDGGKSFSTVSMVNDAHGILPPISLVAANGSETLGVSYHDERLPGHEIFFNRSDNGGKTWANPDQRLDESPLGGRANVVQDPHTVAAGHAWISVWTDHILEDGRPVYRLLSRQTIDTGLSWAPIKELYRSDHHMSAIEVRAEGGTVVVVGDELQAGIFSFISKDAGVTWATAGTLAGTEKITNSGLALAMHEGWAHIVWIREKEGMKPQIMRASLNVNEAKWLEPAARLDVKKTDSTMSMVPVILATKKEGVVAAWIDYRDIRPNIYLSSSKDHGKNWTAPQPMEVPGEISLGWPQLFAWGDGAAIAYEKYPEELINKGSLVIKKLSLAKDGSGFESLPAQSAISQEQKGVKLNQRIKKLWDARVAGDFSTAYEIFDFTYRSLTPKKAYLENVGVINYLSYKDSQVSLSENEASVVTNVTYEMKPFILPSTGKEISVKQTTVDLPTKWVWVGNEWYLVYAPAFDVQLLKY